MMVAAAAAASAVATTSSGLGRKLMKVLQTARVTNILLKTGRNRSKRLEIGIGSGDMFDHVRVLAGMSRKLIKRNQTDDRLRRKQLKSGKTHATAQNGSKRQWWK